MKIFTFIINIYEENMYIFKNKNKIINKLQQTTNLLQIKSNRSNFSFFLN